MPVQWNGLVENPFGSGGLVLYQGTTFSRAVNGGEKRPSGPELRFARIPGPATVLESPTNLSSRLPRLAVGTECRGVERSAVLSILEMPCLQSLRAMSEDTR